MNTFYKEELKALRQGSADFARKYPSLAPMLASSSTDPDVERILEGTAYLCARIHERLSRNAPQLLQNLLRLTFPQALLPLPSMTMIRFRPRQGFNETLFIPRGARLAARPSAGVACQYSTDHDLLLLPARVAAVRSEPPSGTPHVRVTLTLRGAHFTGPAAKEPLILHLAGPYALAAQRFFVLLRQLERVEVNIGGRTHILPASCLRQHFFPLLDPRIPTNRARNRAYMAVTRFFYLPEQLLFLRLDGLESLPAADAADITFCLGRPLERIPEFGPDSFALGVVSASNVFTTFAEPLTIDHTQVEYPLRPQNDDAENLEILNFASVTGLFPGSRVEQYLPYEFTKPGDTEYIYSKRFLPTDDPARTEYWITPLYAASGGVDALQKHSLSVELICSNRIRHNALQAGDICLPTDSSPAQAVFENITAPTAMQPRPQKDLQLWLYLSHRSANLLPQASAELLQAMLKLYIYDNTASPEIIAINTRRCASILTFECREEDRLIRGRLYRGWRLHLVLEPSGFASIGDLFLFGCTLDRFCGEFSAINNYTRLCMDIAGTGDRLEWPLRMGDRQVE
ncbi:MAG: type VI secretion system baseplate subunit TssF [Desulfovibrio sp.]|jgi:type VI secretion system protein ImpG|nr:type VI secretion system baseplate subunit TssF [Desulfovibrio sp.]